MHVSEDKFRLARDPPAIVEVARSKSRYTPRVLAFGRDMPSGRAVLERQRMA